ncbi:MAG: TlpA family protein disulfide reductase [Bacteriovoracia bacterium]
MTDPASSTRNHSWKRFIPIVAPIVVIIAIAIGGLSFLKSQVGAPGADGDGHAEVRVGATLPDFTLSRFRGGKIEYSKLKHKIALINFWATWCEACVIEMPSIVKLREAFQKDGFEVITINVDENPEAVMGRALEQFKIDFAAYYDADQELSRFFDVHAIPFTVILDKDRKVLMAESGDRDWNSQQVHAQMKEWLK